MSHMAITYKFPYKQSLYIIIPTVSSCVMLELIKWLFPFLMLAKPLNVYSLFPQRKDDIDISSISLVESWAWMSRSPPRLASSLQGRTSTV